jgi:PAS domain S-box-containing protein
MAATTGAGGFRERYRRALYASVMQASDGDGDEIADAVLVGRAALAAGKGITELLATHQSVLEEFLGASASASASAPAASLIDAVIQAGAFLIEAAAPFEMTHRGWQDVVQRLRAALQQLTRAQRIAHMGSYARDLLADQAEWSDEMYRIFGVTRESYVTSTAQVLGLIHPEDRADFIAAQEQARRGTNPSSLEYRIIRPDGAERLLYDENELVCDAAQTPRYLIGIVQDITERRRTEAQLRQAQKMEAIGNLMGGVAHDFNNLLGIIIGNLDLAREQVSSNSELFEIVEEARQAARRGADLTRRLLAFARRQPLRPARIDVNALIVDTVRLLRRVLGDDIEVTLNLDARLWPVTIDRVQFEAALINLATNARDAMSGGGRLSIRTTNAQLDADYAASHIEVNPGDFIMIEVSDTGIGMSAETASRIFEPFFTTKQPGKGTGLGLSMVFGFLRQSGGHVNVYSEAGVGTSFRLYFPRTFDPVEAAVGSVLAPAAHGNGEVVLVVEDDGAMRRFAARRLRQLGYRAIEAERASAALELLHARPVDLLLTDVVMPGGLDGAELARLALQRWPALKIVLSSGFPELRTNVAAEFAANLRLLSKPYSKDELARTVRAALDEQNPRTSPIN